MKQYYYDFILLLVAFIWGSGFIVADIAIETWPPVFITAMRLSIAAISFYIIRAKHLKNIKAMLWPGAVIGFYLAVGFIFQTIALNYTTPSKNAFLTSTNVIITPFIYFIFTGKLIHVRTLIGAILALISIAILNFNGASLLGINRGDILTLICSVFFAFNIYFTGHYLKKKQHNLDAIVFSQLLFAALISWLFVPILEDIPLHNITIQSVWPIFYLGLLPTLLCYFLQNFAQQRVSPNKTAVILSLEAFFGTIFSIIFRAELLTANMLVGFTLFFVAILIVELQGLPRKKGVLKDT